MLGNPVPALELPDFQLELARALGDLAFEMGVEFRQLPDQARPLQMGADADEDLLYLEGLGPMTE